MEETMLMSTKTAAKAGHSPTHDVEVDSSARRDAGSALMKHDNCMRASKKGER